MVIICFSNHFRLGTRDSVGRGQTAVRGCPFSHTLQDIVSMSLTNGCRLLCLACVMVITRYGMQGTHCKFSRPGQVSFGINESLHSLLFLIRLQVFCDLPKDNVIDMKS